MLATIIGLVVFAVAIFLIALVGSVVNGGDDFDNWSFADDFFSGVFALFLLFLVGVGGSILFVGANALGHAIFGLF